MRRQFLRGLVLSPLAAWLGLGASPAAAIIVPDLKARLENDLRPQMPSDFEFIALVVDLVQKDQLPLAVVERVYLWARQKPTNRMRYFVVALRVQARKAGVLI